MFLPDIIGIEDAGSRIERIHRRVNSKLHDLAGQNNGAVKWANVVAGAGSVRSSAGTYTH